MWRNFLRVYIMALQEDSRPLKDFDNKYDIWFTVLNW